jgi:hypothetical protein
VTPPVTATTDRPTLLGSSLAFSIPDIWRPIRATVCVTCRNYRCLAGQEQANHLTGQVVRRRFSLAWPYSCASRRPPHLLPGNASQVRLALGLNESVLLRIHCPVGVRVA